MKLFSFIILISLSIIVACSKSPEEKVKWKEYFDSAGTKGTAIVLFISNKQEYFYNKNRTDNRYSVGSSFNILNILFALESGVIKSTSDTLHYRKDDLSKGFMRVDSAYKLNHYPLFKEMAIRIGANKMKSYLKKIEYYGTMGRIGDLENFWQDSTLVVSTKEDIQLWKDLSLYNLPFGKSYQKQVLALAKDNNFEDLNVLSVLSINDEDKICRYSGFIDINSNLITFSINFNTKNITKPDSIAKSIATKIFNNMNLMKKEK